MATPAQQRGTSPLRAVTALRQPNFRPTTQGGEGGSLGVYSHAGSPLRKSASTNLAVPDQEGARSRARPEKRAQSPDKRMSMPLGGLNSNLAHQRINHLKPDQNRRVTGRF